VHEDATGSKPHAYFVMVRDGAGNVAQHYTLLRHSDAIAMAPPVLGHEQEPASNAVLFMAYLMALVALLMLGLMCRTCDATGLRKFKRVERWHRTPSQSYHPQDTRTVTAA